MIAIKSVCQHCGQHIEHPEDMTGQVIECPSCAISTRLGAGSQRSAGVPPAQSPAKPKGPRAKRRTVVRSTIGSVFLYLIGVLMAAPAALFMFAGIVGGAMLTNSTEDHSGTMVFAFLVGIIPLVLGLALITAGWRRNRVLVCKNCGNDVTREARLCVSCHSPLI